MKKLTTILLSLWASVTLMAQIVKLEGTVYPINRSGVNGAYAGFFDSAKNELQLSGAVNVTSVRFTTSPQEASTLLTPTQITSAVFDNNTALSLNNPPGISNFTFTNANTYLTVANDVTTFNLFGKPVMGGKEYKIFFNSGTTPVAYAIFTAVPEPEATAAVAGLGIVVGGFVIKRQKNKTV